MLKREGKKYLLNAESVVFERERHYQKKKQKRVDNKAANYRQHCTIELSLKIQENGQI